MNFRLGYCDMCDGTFRCAANCPTGALRSFDPYVDKIGMARVNESECELYGVSAHCNAPCVEACAWEALAVEDGRLIVDEEKCNGCGACEFACVAVGLTAPMAARACAASVLLPGEKERGDERERRDIGEGT